MAEVGLRVQNPGSMFQGCLGERFQGGTVLRSEEGFGERGVGFGWKGLGKLHTGCCLV